ncbi:MAG: Chemotaxis protein CheA [Pseudomonadota bacterium]|jgi:two-component system chemotaxis sensor kinase CheA
MLGNVGKRLRLLESGGRIVTEFQRAMVSFTALSHGLQRSIMEIRKVPIQVVLQKVPRLVRDVAEALGKQVEVRLSGSEISVDKSLLEALEAPLGHMVRNAVDHGIELPEVRHLYIQQQHVRLELDDAVSPDERVRRPAHDFDLPVPGQDLRHDLAHDGRVVDDQDANRHGRAQ